MASEKKLRLVKAFRFPLFVFLSLFVWSLTCEARILPRTLVLSQCEYYPNREQDGGFLGRYTDQPLFVCPDLPEDATYDPNRHHRYWGEWYSQADWNMTDQLGAAWGLDGHCFFPRPHRHRYWGAAVKSPVAANFYRFPISATHSTDGSDFLAWFGNAITNPVGYYVNGKALIMGYWVEKHDTAAKLGEKLNACRAKYGDKFLFVSDISSIAQSGEFNQLGKLTAATREKHKATLRDYLRVSDGIYTGDTFSMIRFEGGDRVFDSKWYEEVTRMMCEVLDESEFKGRKLLALSALITHSNPTRFFWTPTADGLRTLTESLRVAVNAKPDIIMLPEWDELNENTCIGPTLANGFSVKRALRPHLAKLRGEGLRPLPGDNLALPNLIISARRMLTPNERFLVDILNVPDGGREGPLEVLLTLLDSTGNVLETLPPQCVEESEFHHARFFPDAAALFAHARAVKLRVTWRKGEAHGTFEEGLHPVEIAPANAWCVKEVHQSVRDLAPMEKCDVSCDGKTFSAALHCAEPIRYAMVMGGGQIQYIAGDPTSPCMRFREDESNAVFQVTSTQLGSTFVKGAHFEIVHAPRAEWFDYRGVSTGNLLRVNWISNVGAPAFVRIPKSALNEALLKVSFPGIWAGEVPLCAAFQKGTWAKTAPRMMQFIVTRFRRQARYPLAANAQNMAFSTALDEDQPSMTYFLQVVTMSGKTWRSRPFVCGECVQAPRISYDFAPGTGDYIPTHDGYRRFSTILGGTFSAATLWNRLSNGLFDFPEGTTPRNAATLDTAPKRFQGEDGLWSFSFDGTDDFVLFPWEVIPRTGSFRLSCDFKPTRLETKDTIEALFASKNLLSLEMVAGEIVVRHSTAGALHTNLKPTRGMWHHLEVSRVKNRLEVILDYNARFSAACDAAAQMPSSLAFAAPARKGVIPFQGYLRELVIDHLPTPHATCENRATEGIFK